MSEAIRQTSSLFPSYDDYYRHVKEIGRKGGISPHEGAPHVTLQSRSLFRVATETEYYLVSGQYKPTQRISQQWVNEDFSLPRIEYNNSLRHFLNQPLTMSAAVNIDQPNHNISTAVLSTLCEGGHTTVKYFISLEERYLKSLVASGILPDGAEIRLWMDGHNPKGPVWHTVANTERFVIPPHNIAHVLAQNGIEFAKSSAGTHMRVGQLVVELPQLSNWPLIPETVLTTMKGKDPQNQLLFPFLLNGLRVPRSIPTQR